ncbi:Na+/H+ antiporter NhaC family protein [Membranihabitans marinus]
MAFFSLNLYGQDDGSVRSDIEIEFPSFTIQNIPYSIIIKDVEAMDGQGEVKVNGVDQKLVFEDGQGVVEHQSNQSETVMVEYLSAKTEEVVHPVPLWWSILPPLLAIFAALLFREVVTSLFFGVFFGASILYIYSEGFWGIVLGFMRTIDHYIVAAISDSGHVSIILFSMLIGAMVAIISKNGGMQGVVNYISRYANNPKNGQLATWILGIAIFFDDYANTLVVGNTMRPVTDGLKVSREKLAYIVDSTAAPIAAIAFVTTWIGAELGYIESGIESLDTLNEGVYATFINSLQYSFYPIYTLIFVLMLVLFQKDFGPMYTAEHRARTTGVVSSVRSETKLDEDDLSEFTPDPGVETRWYNAVVPVFTVVLGTIAGLLYTGWDVDVWANQDMSLGLKLSEIIGQADSYQALLWSSLGGVMIAVIMTLYQRIMNLESLIRSATSGFKTMLSAIIILSLAWSLAAVTEDLHTADFLTQLMSDNVAPWVIPTITFLLAALVAFSTGSSWGTMAILYPLMLPATWMLAHSAGYDYDVSLIIFHNVVASVLAGSVLGDHCSPISDTTILSSLASSCHHIDHVKTQLPYALLVGMVAIFIGVLPASLGVSSWILFPTGILVMYFIIRKFGKSTVLMPND